MAATYKVRGLYQKLTRDSWRDENPFSEDITLANKLLFHPFSTESEKTDALALWFQKNQPCLFGSIAAPKDWLHYGILTDEDLQSTDQHISERIRDELLMWKRRSLRPTTEFSNPAHGFILLAISERLALAAPNEQLYQFASALRDLWGCSHETNDTGTVHLETLYLQHPTDKTYVKFTFSVDFFAAQGDKRWWHDHRVPGGIVFTANSIGHMRRYREWYSNKTEQLEWLLQTAMLTIDKAADTPYGKATWLKSLSPGGSPIVASIACPFSTKVRLKENLQGKDWTRYGGHLHTDHSIRREFFHSSPEKPQDLAKQEWLADFTYLYDPRGKDHVRFVAGELIAEDDVFRTIGNPIDWPKIHSARKPKARGLAQTGRTSQQNEEITELLTECGKWALRPDELNPMLDSI